VTLDDLRNRYNRLCQDLKEYRADIDRWNSMHPGEEIAYDDSEIVALIASIRKILGGEP
jgi:hypothetical protein